MIGNKTGRFTLTSHELRTVVQGSKASTEFQTCSHVFFQKRERADGKLNGALSERLNYSRTQSLGCSGSRDVCR